MTLKDNVARRRKLLEKEGLGPFYTHILRDLPSGKTYWAILRRYPHLTDLLLDELGISSIKYVGPKSLSLIDRRLTYRALYRGMSAEEAELALGGCIYCGNEKLKKLIRKHGEDAVLLPPNLSPYRRLQLRPARDRFVTLRKALGSKRQQGQCAFPNLVDHLLQFNLNIEMTAEQIETALDISDRAR